jgi:hypothetical protein
MGAARQRYAAGQAPLIDERLCIKAVVVQPAFVDAILHVTSVQRAVIQLA